MRDAHPEITFADELRDAAARPCPACFDLQPVCNDLKSPEMPFFSPKCDDSGVNQVNSAISMPLLESASRAGLRFEWEATEDKRC